MLLFAAPAPWHLLSALVSLRASPARPRHPPCPRSMWREIQLQALACTTLWACCDDTSSDDDDHNTSNPLLFLCADALVAPVLLAGLSDVEELEGCLELQVRPVEKEERVLLSPVKVVFKAATADVWPDLHGEGILEGKKNKIKRGAAFCRWTATRKRSKGSEDRVC